MYDRSKGIGLLLREVSRLLRKRFNELAKGSGLAEPQWNVLKALRREEGIPQRVLAERIGIEPITLVKHLDRLEGAGYVRRDSDPADRRVRLVYLNEKAGPLLRRMSEWAREIRQESLQGFTDAEVAALRTALDRLKVNLTEAAEPARPGLSVDGLRARRPEGEPASFT